MEKKHQKDIRKCDGCATKKTCFVYYPGRYAIDCVAWVKERKTKEKNKKPTFIFTK